MRIAYRLLIIALMPAALAACSITSPQPHDEPAAPLDHKVGGDRDAHGCIASAGYQWCERTGNCVRSWELAEEAGFENTADAFAQYCTAKDDPPSTTHR